jgi:D-mycarose 3-C-methyltransferase
VLCEGPKLEKIYDFGNLPLPNLLPLPNDAADRRYPLDLVRCGNCGHFQLGHVVPPAEMFTNYTYVPSTSQFLRNHFRELASTIASLIDVSGRKLVVDIGSNDGLLLSFLQDEHDAWGIGVDPAKNLVAAAADRGVYTLNRLFDEKMGQSMVDVWGEATVITATNCLAHTAALRSYLRGVETLLAKDGIFVVEVPYGLELLKSGRFDTIYHEHQSYFTLEPLINCLPELGLKVSYAKYMEDVHGGSMRIFIQHAHAPPRDFPGGTSRYWIGYESSQTWNGIIRDFVRSVNAVKRNTQAALEVFSSKGTVYGIGASAKAAVMLNFAEISPRTVKAVADANPRKQGRMVPGVRIPIVPEAELAKADYVVDFIWNLKSDVKAKLKEYNPSAQLVEIFPEVTVERA